MILNLEHLPRVIPVGIQTESGVEEIGFDLSPWLTRWPGMTCAVWPTRPGESAAYPAANVEMVGNVLYWYPSSADTEKEGAGTVEVVGVVADKCKTTGPIDTLVKETSLDVTQETPEPIVPWFEELQKTGGIAQQGAADAAASAVEAAEKAAEAGQHAATAGQHSTNAGAQANAAKSHAEAAATSAENAEKAKQTAIDNADDAEEAAKSAQEWAGRAETFASNAGTAADAAATSAKEATESAKQAAAHEEAAISGMQGSDGRGGLFLVTVNSEQANRTQAEIREAVSEGKTCILTDDLGCTYTYLGKTDYWGDANEKNCPTFIRYERLENGIAQHEARVLSTGAVAIGYQNGYAKTPNPKMLTVAKGGETIKYNGSKDVTVDVPDVLIVTVGAGFKSSHTDSQIVAALQAGKTVSLLHDREVYTFRAIVDGAPMFERLYAVRGGDYEAASGTGVYWSRATVQADGTVEIRGGIPAKTPSPASLTFTGAVSARYDGSEQVTINIPTGGSGGGNIPDPGVPNQQLVSDEDGKAVWRDIPADVQPDWSQMDETAPDYVKGRTHYFRAGLQVSVNDKFVRPPDEELGAMIAEHATSGTQTNTIQGYMYKISDATPTVSEFLKGNVVTSVGGVVTELTEENINNETSAGYSIIADVYGTGKSLVAAVCFESGYEARGEVYNQVMVLAAELPAPGIYVATEERTDGKLGVKIGLDWPDNLLPLDDKYIPETIARKDDLHEPVSDEHINGLIDNKMDAFEDEIIPEVVAAADARVEDRFDLFGKAVCMETTMTFGSGIGSTTVPWNVVPVAGKSYKVVINGEKTTMTATSVPAEYGMPEDVVLMGTIGGEIALICFPVGYAELDGITLMVRMQGSELKGDYPVSILDAGSPGYYYFDGTTAKLVSIKELREAIFSSGAILEETTVECSPDMDYMGYIFTPLSGTPEAGSTYTVMYNGTAYDCPALLYEEEGMSGVMLGNTDAIGAGAGNPGAPFVMVLMPAGMDFGDGTMLYGMVMDLDGASSAALSITEAGGGGPEYMTREQVVALINEMMGNA